MQGHCGSQLMIKSILNYGFTSPGSMKAMWETLAELTVVSLHVHVDIQVWHNGRINLKQNSNCQLPASFKDGPQ